MQNLLWYMTLKMFLHDVSITQFMSHILTIQEAFSMLTFNTDTDRFKHSLYNIFVFCMWIQTHVKTRIFCHQHMALSKLETQASNAVRAVKFIDINKQHLDTRAKTLQAQDHLYITHTHFSHAYKHIGDAVRRG